MKKENFKYTIGTPIARELSDSILHRLMVADKFTNMVPNDGISDDAISIAYITGTVITQKRIKRVMEKLNPNIASLAKSITDRIKAVQAIYGNDIDNLLKSYSKNKKDGCTYIEMFEYIISHIKVHVENQYLDIAFTLGVFFYNEFNAGE